MVCVTVRVIGVAALWQSAGVCVTYLVIVPAVVVTNPSSVMSPTVGLVALASPVIWVVRAASLYHFTLVLLEVTVGRGAIVVPWQ